MNVIDLLGSGREPPVTVADDATVLDASRLMRAHNISALLVTGEDGSAVGVVSERDIVRAVETWDGQVANVRVFDLMSRSLITCAPDTSIEQASALMTTKGIRHIPVADSGGILGVLSIRDFSVHRIRALEAANDSLRENQEHYARLTQASPNPILIHRRGTIEFANPAAAALLGLSDAETLKGRQILEFVHADSQHYDTLWDDALVAMDAPTDWIETRHVAADGSEFFAHARVLRFRWHEQPASLVFLRETAAPKQSLNAKFERGHRDKGAVADEPRNLAAIGHSMRSPVEAVIAMAETLLAESLGDAQREKVEAIQAEAEALNSALNAIIDPAEKSAAV